MDYLKIYNSIMIRAKKCDRAGYTELHHVIPRCMGGSDLKDNLVRLTPEEHYLAHQLLVKIYPENKKLLHAAIMMIPASGNQCRRNKLYGWLRRRYASAAKERTGGSNGSFGKPWYHNPVTGNAGKYFTGTQPVGWIRGRVPKKISMCTNCGNVVTQGNAAFCFDCRNERKVKRNNLRKQQGYKGREKELQAYLTAGLSINAALKEMGYTGNNGPISAWARQVKDN